VQLISRRNGVHLIDCSYNADKTGVIISFIWGGSKHNLAKLQHHDVTVTVVGTVPRRFNQSMSSDTLVFNELSMKQHVIKVAGACFHQLRHLRQIQRRVGREVTTRLVLALVWTTVIQFSPDYQHLQSTSCKESRMPPLASSVN